VFTVRLALKLNLVCSKAGIGWWRQRWGDQSARAAAQILLVFHAAAQLKADFVRRRQLTRA